MSVIDDLKVQIAAGKISFDPPATTADRLKKELLGESTGTNATPLLQNLVLQVSKAKSIRISSIVRAEGHHSEGRAFDVANEEIASSLLPGIATNSKVAELKIDEIIFDAGVVGEIDRNKWNYDEGVKHNFDDSTLEQHKNHIHFAVKAG